MVLCSCDNLGGLESKNKSVLMDCRDLGISGRSGQDLFKSRIALSLLSKNLKINQLWAIVMCADIHLKKLR